MQEQVDVRVDQSGHQRNVAEVDYFRTSRMRDGRAGFGNTFTLDEYFARRDNPPCFDIEQARGVKNRGVTG
jgi:hypothetical protein